MQQQSYFNGCCWCPSMASPNMMNSNNDSKPWLLFDKIATNGPTLIRNLYQISNVTILWTWSEIDRWETEDQWSKGDLDHTWWSRNYCGPWWVGFSEVWWPSTGMSNLSPYILSQWSRLQPQSHTICGPFCGICRVLQPQSRKIHKFEIWVHEGPESLLFSS